MRISFIIFLVILFSCSRRPVDGYSLAGKYYESLRGPLFGGNKLWLNKDSTFRLVKSGRAYFLSEGKWTYNDSKNEIKLTAGQSTIKYRTAIDTLWLDLNGKVVKVRNKKQLFFDEAVYYLK